MKRYPCYDLFLVEEVIEAIESKKQKREQVIHKDFVKKHNRESVESDYVDKDELFFLMQKYLCNDTPKSEKKKVREILMKKYEIMVRNILKHSSFYNYEHHDKEDIVQECLLLALATGSDETNENYGIEYFCRFDVENRDNVFAFWTQQIKNNIFKYLNETYYPNINVKQACLQSTIMQFNAEWCSQGIDAKKAIMVEGIDGE